MKILYGVQATGNGHISRSREVVKALKERGHEIYVILSGREPKNLWDIQVFEPYSVFKGFTFITKNGKIKLLSTAGNLEFFSFFNDIRGFNAGDYELVVTDFEPVTARIAKRRNIPCIGIGHQYAFSHNIPIAGRDIVAMAILKYFAPADYYMGLHWHHFGCEILPPIVPSLDTSGVSVEPQKILVYLPFEDIDDIKALIDKFTDNHFYVYADVKHPSENRHIHIRPFSRTGFLDDLLTCEGVISNAGFELVSESIHTGKKILVKPLKGQLEQESNALALKELNLGTMMKSLDRNITKRWLDIKKPRPFQYPDVAAILAEWIGSGKWNNRSEVVADAWKGVQIR